MNRVYSILGALIGLIILTSVVWQSLVIVHFYANQSEIESIYCVNKERPALNCHGQCHLNKTLNQTSQSLEVNDRSTTSPRAGLIVLQFRSAFRFTDFTFNTTTKHVFFHSNKEKTKKFHPFVFDPPESIQVA